MKSEVIAALCCLLAADRTWADTPPPGNGAQLEQIVVTAKKRAQDVQNVPQAVDVVGGATLRKLSLPQFQDVQASRLRPAAQR